MYVLHLTQPGVRLRGLTDEVEFEMRPLFFLLQGCIDDVAVSLTMFEEALESSIAATVAMSDRRRELSRTAARGEQVDRWANPDPMPRVYRHRLPFIHAKTFIYAMDTIQKTLEVLVERPGSPAEVAVALEHFRLAFPDLIHVRNSAHHVEDRVRGMARARKIKLQPAPQGQPASKGGMTIDRLDDNIFGCTLADGTYGQIEVSPDAAYAARHIVQRVFDAYPWSGPPIRHPQ